MLDELLKRDDVLRFINLLKNNERYFKKEKNIIFCDYFNPEYLALFIFYDALVKYKIIVDDIYLFEEFMEQLDKIYKKIDNFDDIRVGINKLIGKMVSIKLEIKNVNNDIQKKEIISYVYNKYILEGYYIHGFNSNYNDIIISHDFTPEEYQNNYDDFIKISNIFLKHNAVNVIEKDFSIKKVDFTDDLVMACYYSKYSPSFYYRFLNNKDYFDKEIVIDNISKDSFNNWSRGLKMFMYDSFFYEYEKKFINGVIKDKWDFLHKKNLISLMLVKRKVINNNVVSLDNYLNDSSDVYDVIDRILSSKVGNISYKNKIAKDDIIVLNFDIEKEIVYNENISYEEEENISLLKVENKSFLNVYGKASILIIIGSLLISLGVIIMIFMVLRGKL